MEVDFLFYYKVTCLMFIIKVLVCTKIVYFVFKAFWCTFTPLDVWNIFIVDVWNIFIVDVKSAALEPVIVQLSLIFYSKWNIYTYIYRMIQSKVSLFEAF